MKKPFFTIAIITALFSIISIAASAFGFETTEQTAHENTRRELIRYITCPHFITDNSDANQIRAVVSVDVTGKVKVEEINSANVQLKNYVFTQLQNIRLRNVGVADKFVLVIKFKAD